MPTILCVEDDPDVRETLTAILEDQGYAVLTAGNGREGLTALASAPTLPDAILLDLRMPVMDGPEFRTHLRLHPEWSHIAVVVCSGTPGCGSNEELEPLAGSFLKPVEVPELLALLQRCCEREAA
ncbi:MAG: chemotaxis protein CheY [Armatimonadetes bacterium]|nr:chemotaxis protein CheY [Armatimonadota bacterium]